MLQCDQHALRLEFPGAGPASGSGNHGLMGPDDSLLRGAGGA
ncbi:MAG TPA: hypothetical protein VGI11_02845 [Variovorax sp.]